MSNPLEDNLVKGKCLEWVTSESLNKIGIKYEDYSGIYNFKGYSGNKSVPDYVANNYVIECKNWNDNYSSNRFKCYNEIVKRYSNFMDKPKILIISSPNWSKSARAYLLSLNIKIIELGYFVDIDNYDRAVLDIANYLKLIFGYSYTKKDIDKKYGDYQLKVGIEKKGYANSLFIEIFLKVISSFRTNIRYLCKIFQVHISNLTHRILGCKFIC